MFQTQNSTESDPNFNYDFAQTYDSAVLEVKDRQLILQRALENIAELQNNLSFMINYNGQLKEENQRLKESQQKNNELINKEMMSKNKELAKIQKEHNQVVQLLEELKEVLNHKETDLKNSEDENKRLHQFVNEQKITIHDLEDKAMNSEILEVSNFSNSHQQYQMAISELERELSETQYELKRSEQQLDLEKQRVHKLERENNEFKKWMATLVGLNKIVDGSEKIVMKEISNRLSN